MRRFLGYAGGVLLALAASGTAQAQEEESPISGSVALGFVGTSGNTETRTYNGDFRLTWNTTNWTHNLRVQAIGSSQDGSTQAERYNLEEKSDYNFGENRYMFVKGTVNADRFSGYTYQASLTGGYGQHLIRNETFTLQMFGGVGYRQSKIRDGATDEEVILLDFGEEITWEISESAAMYQKLNSEVGEDLVLTTFEIGLETTIIGNIATKLAFQARHNSDPPINAESTDTQTSISLTYQF